LTAEGEEEEEEEEEEEMKVYSAEMVSLHVHMTWATVAKREASCVGQWRYSSRIDMLSPGEA
jgi:hypothetical protein